METIKILDLFAGVGGLSLGFELVKDDFGKNIFELHRAVEIDEYATETLKNRYGKARVIKGDITKFAIAKQIIDDCKGKVSVVVGGIPCQSFSLIGPRSGFGKKMEKFQADNRDNLYEHFRDIVAEIKPNVIVIENVKGILSKKDFKGELIINKIFSDFETLGYNFENDYNNKKYMLLDSADYGVPQRRERVILIGIKREWKDIKVPYIYPTHYDPQSKEKEILEKKGLKPHVTLFEAIGDLPKVHPKITYTGLSKNMVTRVKKRNPLINRGNNKIEIDLTSYYKHIERVNDSGKLFLKHVRPNGYNYIDYHIARSQQLSDIKLFSLLKEGETAKEFVERAPKTANKLIKYDMNSFLDKYRRQSWDSTSTTIFAHLEKDGNRFIHPIYPRTYTPREAARIQSFPDDFVFCGPTNKKFKQIGNAVPPLLSKAIASSVKKIL